MNRTQRAIKRSMRQKQNARKDILDMAIKKARDDGSGTWGESKKCNGHLIKQVSDYYRKQQKDIIDYKCREKNLKEAVRA